MFAQANITRKLMTMLISLANKLTGNMESFVLGLHEDSDTRKTENKCYIWILLVVIN